MKWTEYKIEIGIAGVAALMILLFVFMSHLMHRNQGGQQEDLTYEMARPKASFAPEFDLANREILRNFMNRLAKNTHGASVTGKSGRQVPPVVNAKTEKKKLTGSTDRKKNPEMTVAIVEADPSQDLADADPVTPDYDYRGGEQSPMVQPKGGPKKKSSEKKAQNSDRDWKKLFMAEPNAKLMSEFVQAYYAKDVTDNLYYDVIKDLILSQNEGNQSLGVSGMKSVSSVRGFSEGTHLSVTPEVQKKAALDEAIHDYLLSYNQRSKLPVLETTLKSRDPVVVLKSTQIISEGFAKVRSGETFGTGRDQRNFTPSSTLSAYQKFIPTLDALRRSSDPSIASAADSLANQIQAVSVAKN